MFRQGKYIIPRTKGDIHPLPSATNTIMEQNVQLITIYPRSMKMQKVEVFCVYDVLPAPFNKLRGTDISLRSKFSYL